MKTFAIQKLVIVRSCNLAYLILMLNLMIFVLINSIAMKLFFVAIILFFVFFKAASAEAKNIEIKKFSILIPSTDKYSELWEPNFTLLFKNWPELLKQDQQVPMYLISNSKDSPHSRVQAFKVGKEKSWSDNLLMLLDQIDSQYVLIWLDDYILTQPVNRDRLANIIDFMDVNHAAYIELIINPSLHDGTAIAHEGLMLRDKFGAYRTSLQACIWRKEALKWLLKSGESAWDFEIKGTLRS
jgi:hypothetical protein